MQTSSSIAQLARALVAFQAEVENPKNTATNPFLRNKYAPLNDILNEVRPLLGKHKLAVSQLVTGQGLVGVTTMLLHESGEYITETVTMETGTEKGKSDAQVAGSIITYLRRYALSAVLGIASEDDTDGNGHHRRPEPRKPEPQPRARDVAGKSIDEMDRKELRTAIGQALEYVADVEAWRQAANDAWTTEGTDELRSVLTRMRKEISK